MNFKIYIFFLVCFFAQNSLHSQTFSKYIHQKDEKILNAIQQKPQKTRTLQQQNVKPEKIKNQNLYRLISITGNMHQLKREFSQYDKSTLAKKLNDILIFNKQLNKIKNPKSVFLYLKSRELFYISIFRYVYQNKKIDNEFVELIQNSYDDTYKNFLNVLTISESNFNNKFQNAKIKAIKNNKLKQKNKIKSIRYFQRFEKEITEDNVESLSLMIAKYQLLKEIVSNFVLYFQNKSYPKTLNDFNDMESFLTQKNIEILLKDKNILDYQDILDFYQMFVVVAEADLL